MTFEDALEARMRADEVIVEPIGGRIEWGRRIDAVSALTLQIVSDPRPQHMKGFHSVRSTDVQIDVWSATAGEAARSATSSFPASCCPPWSRTSSSSAQ